MSKWKMAFFAFFAAAFFSLFFFSCGDFSDIGIPEKVSVKSNGTYCGALGQKYFDLSSRFGTDMMSDLNDSASADVYKYIPDANDQTLQYLLHKKVYDVPLNVADYISSMGLGDELSDSLAFSKDIELPEVSKNSDVTILAGAEGPFPFSLVVNLTLDSTISSATIGAGAIIVKAPGSGAVLDVADFSLSGITKGDGSAYSAADFVANTEAGDFLINKKLDLNGAKLVIPASQIQASGTISKTSGAFGAASQLSSSLNIQSLSSAVADLSGIGGFVMNESSDNKKKVSSEMVAYVDTIKFGKANGNYYYKSDASGNITETKGLGKGIKFKAVNSFPAGNDIKLDIVSQTFGINSTDGSIYVDGEPATSAMIAAKGNSEVFEPKFSEYGDVDVTDQALFGTKDSPAWIKFSVSLSSSQTFSNLTMGQKYSIKVSDTEMLFDWDEVSINLSNADPVAGNQDMSGFSISSIMSEVDGEISRLVDNCDFESMPAYFLVQKPAGALAQDIGDISMSGKVYLTYTDRQSVAKTEYIAGSASESVQMPSCQAMDWPASGGELNKVFATQGSDYSFKTDLASCMNQRPDDLKVNYSMGLAGGSACDLYKARLDSLGPNDKTSISVEMAAVIPFKLNVTQDTGLDVYALSEMDVADMTDVMYRDSVSKTEEYAAYSSAITTLRINYNFINTAVDGFNAVVNVDDTHQGAADASAYSGIVRNLELKGTAEDAVVFNDDEIKAILTHFFMPKMTITVLKGPLTIKRSAVESSSALGISPVIFLQLNESSAVDITNIIK
ncbi:MAG: hypothetical protein K6A42_10045 [Treponema sp.]|nr:hypothetical protein [Treponema sp.]